MARKTRTPTPTSPLDAVAGLIEERAKFEQWLEDLEAKRDSTPQKVYDRVHNDYLSRLQGVMEQLKSHTEELQTHAAALNKRLMELSSAEESRVEERAEAELRAKVGEMTPAEWDSVSKKADRELAKLKEDQELIETDLDRIQGILDELSGGTPARTSGGAPAPKVDEMEFLKSVVGTGPRPAVAAPAAPPSHPPGASEASRRTSGATEPAVQTSPSSSGQPSTPAPTAAAAAPVPPVAPAKGKPTPAAGAPTVGTPDPHAPTVSDQPKTLKCQDCGAMNYPSEWYCEKCGAELTVV